jgi:two-component system cell cycle sensor histidine kinase/response regulator CckA
MTEKTAETTILDAETFDAFRPILGQIAHDFNNLLTPLLAYPGLLRTYLGKDSQGNELLDAIDRASRDMIHINEQLMLLASRGVPDRAEHNIPELLESVIARLASEVDLSRIRLVRKIDRDMPKVQVSPEHLSKAVANLLANAFECRNDEVTVTLSARAVKITPDMRARYGAPYAGEYLQIGVADNGPGFSPEILPRAAMPFVTTKKEMKRRGSGLGLTVALLISRDHGGFLFLENVPGGGASASIFLPVVRQQQASAAGLKAATARDSAGGIEPRRKDRILLVDDEQTILKLFHMIISSALPDCEIETAANGKEALDLFGLRHHGCVVMDLHMPLMDGQTAFQELLTIAKERGWEPPAVVFCTGFAPPDMVNRVVAGNSMHCLLSKPVRGEVLVDAIKSRIS